MGGFCEKIVSPDTSYQTKSSTTGQSPKFSGIVQPRVFSSMFVHCFHHILLTMCPIDPILFPICSSPYCSVLALGFELGI
jgi:hypothetical protein